MNKDRHFFMKWPELDMSVECEPLEYNRCIYDWWLDHMPIRAVQSHAAVTGDVFYTLNIRLPEKGPVFPKDELKIELMTKAPEGYGTFSYNAQSSLAGGRVGLAAVYYGPVHEEMDHCLSFKVIDRDIEKVKEAGRAIWKAIYKTKDIITVEMSVKQ